MHEIPVNTDRATREELRWVLLRALWYARPLGCNENILRITAQDGSLPVTTLMIRQELNYLSKCKLVQLNNKLSVWHAELTADGENVVDYRTDCPLGIARPQQW